MNIITTLAFKDLCLLARDRMGLFWILVFPLLNALFFGTVLGGMGSKGAGALPIAVVEEESSPPAQKFIERLEKSASLRVERLPLAEAQEAVRKGNLVAYVVVPRGFGAGGMWFNNDGPGLKVGIDPSRRAEAGYLQGILVEASFASMQDQMTDPKKVHEQVAKALDGVDRNEELKPEQKLQFKRFFGELDQFMSKLDPGLAREGGGWRPASIELIDLSASPEAGAQPRSAFEITFPSSILWGLMGCVATFAVSIVTERVQGTWLRLQIAPISWGHILAGKGLACFLTSISIAIVLLLLGWGVFGVRLGQVGLLALGIGCTAFCFSGIMMFLSTIGKTQEGVAGAGWGIMLPFAMLGGSMIPLIAMPSWMLTASHFSPVKWGILALEGAIWRNFSLVEMLSPCGILLAIGAVGFSSGIALLARREVA
jgi:linearmycin/streptolysin S transport system permease protein